MLARGDSISQKSTGIQVASSFLHRERGQETDVFAGSGVCCTVAAEAVVADDDKVSTLLSEGTTG